MLIVRQKVEKLNSTLKNKVFENKKNCTLSDVHTYMTQNYALRNINMIKVFFLTIRGVLYNFKKFERAR